MNVLLRKPVALGIVLSFTALAVANYFRLSQAIARGHGSRFSDGFSITLAVGTIIFCYYALFGNWRRKRSGSVAQLAIVLLTLVITPLQCAIIFTVVNEHAVCLPADPPPTAGNVLYFSYVTFTTLGYGDIAPLGICKGLAAATALTGYMTLGAFMAILMQQTREEKE